MSSSQNEKKNSNVEMGEASLRLSRRSAEKETSRTSAEMLAIPSSYALSISAEGNKSLSDAAPLVGTDTAPVHVPEVLAQHSGSSTTPLPILDKGQVMESMPPPLDRKEIVLGLSAPSATPLPKTRNRNGAATETAKKRRCSKGAEGEPSGPLPQYRAKFISLIDGMISDCGLQVELLTEGLAESLEALKRIEATLKSTEDAHAAETSQLEVQVSGLERDLGKSASALFRMKKEKKGKASEVPRLQRQIHSQEEPRTREPAGTVIPRDEFHARLTRMAVLFDSLMAVRKKDLALAGIKGGLGEIQLLKGELVPTLDSAEARLLSHKEELMASKGDFDSILSLLKSECTLTPCLEETEGQGRAAEEGEGDAVKRGDDEVAEGGDGDAVPSSDEVEDEGGASRSAYEGEGVSCRLIPPPDDHCIHRLLSTRVYVVFGFMRRLVKTSSKAGFRARPRFTLGLRLCDDKSTFVLPVCDFNLIRTDIKSANCYRLILLVLIRIELPPNAVWRC
ncbi:hypothetical protein F2Q69_00027789 [Brassica cretica]|uniref:Uncharacterized protein n=1 Tax=Brassica cretica TaxID=69181 RepID=A0A8S9RRU5_BRACR|nr:hypothetical protein F2Q69_00027789 [Brassica cretica]